MTSIVLQKPLIERNRICYAWTGPALFSRNSYWVEYPDFDRIRVSDATLLETLFPLCLAFSAVEGAAVQLPLALPPKTAAAWDRAIEVAAKTLFRTAHPSLPSWTDAEPPRLPPPPASSSKTGLFFGGGTESLLVLAQALEAGEKLSLLSFGGTKWSGSDPEKNPSKFKIDSDVAQEFGLELLRVRTNVREMIDPKRWSGVLKPGVSIVNAVMLLPLFVSFGLPLRELAGIGRLVSGNEKMNFPREYFCFSPPMTDALALVSPSSPYESRLGHWLKEEVVHELYTRFPHVARRQYSCWKNDRERWCHRCESCFEYFALAKLNGLDPAVLGLDENRIWSDIAYIVRVVGRSPEARPGEIWLRLRNEPVLRADPRMRNALDDIALMSALVRPVYKVYGKTPEWFKKKYRAQKERIVSRASRPKDPKEKYAHSVR